MVRPKAEHGYSVSNFFFTDREIRCNPYYDGQSRGQEPSLCHRRRTQASALPAISVLHVRPLISKYERFPHLPCSTQTTRDMFDVISSCAQAVADRLTAEINTSTDPKHGKKFNIPDWTGRATLDIIGHFAFDYDFECGENDVAKTIQRSWKEQCSLVMGKAGFVVSGADI
jgi:hypothetical protein